VQEKQVVMIPTETAHQCRTSEDQLDTYNACIIRRLNLLVAVAIPSLSAFEITTDKMRLYKLGF